MIDKLKYSFYSRGVNNIEKWERTHFDWHRFNRHKTIINLPTLSFLPKIVDLFYNIHNTINNVTFKINTTYPYCDYIFVLYGSLGQITSLVNCIVVDFIKSNIIEELTLRKIKTDDLLKMFTIL